MPSQLKFELVSPVKQLASLEAEMVVVPGEEGDLGILAEHAPLMSSLRPGVITIYQNGAVDQKIFVNGGFAEVNPEGLIVLAEEALPVADIAVDKATEELEEIKRKLSKLSSDDEFEKNRLEKLQTAILAKIESAGA